MKKKIESISCTSLGSVLANPTPSSLSDLAQFKLQVSTKAYGSGNIPSSNPEDTVDWDEVEQVVIGYNPITIQPFSTTWFRDVLQKGSRTVDIFVDETYKSYRVLAQCIQCPASGSWWVAASGSFEV